MTPSENFGFEDLLCRRQLRDRLAQAFILTFEVLHPLGLILAIGPP